VAYFAQGERDLECSTVFVGIFELFRDFRVFRGRNDFDGFICRGDTRFHER